MSSTYKRARLHIRRLPKELQPYAIKRLTELDMINSKYQSFTGLIKMIIRFQNGYGRDNKNKRAIREWLRKYEESQQKAYTESDITYVWRQAIEHMDRLFTITAEGSIMPTGTPTYWVNPFE